MRCRSRTRTGCGRRTGDVADVGQDPGGDEGPHAVQVHQARPTSDDHRLELGGGFLRRLDVDARAPRRRSAGGSSRRCRGAARWRASALACPVVMSFFACPGSSSARSACNRSTTCTRRRLRASQRSTSSRIASAAPSRASTRRPVVRTATIAIECASCGSLLAPVSGVEDPHPRGVFAGTSTTCSPSASSRCANGRPTPLAPSTAQVRPATP